MYKKLTPLKHTDHADLRVLPVNDYGFARGELVAPIVIDEIADVAREYPIVFPVGSKLPVALMGVEKDANAYVGTNGAWLATYIPAHIRHYPLAMTRVPVKPPKADGEKADAMAQTKEEVRMVVLVDEESPLVSRTEGLHIFSGKGKLSNTAERLVRLMEQMQSRVGLTQSLVQAVEESGLLVERAIRIKREGEADRQVNGIRVIDEAALNQMNDEAFNNLRKSGALPLVYASLLSWANFRQGPIGKSHPLPAPSGVNLDDVIRFN